MIKDSVIEDLYKDILKKRNKCKIDLDNYISEIEILKRNIEYNTSIVDDSRFFSPRNQDSLSGSNDELNDKIEKYERLVEETKEQFEYYDSYCSRLAFLINNEDDKDISKSDEESLRDDINYSLNLNYDVEEVKNKLLTIKNRLDLCLKIFDNDKNRTKQEILNIGKSIDQILDIIS